MDTPVPVVVIIRSANSPGRVSSTKLLDQPFREIAGTEPMG